MKNLTENLNDFRPDASKYPNFQEMYFHDYSL